MSAYRACCSRSSSDSTCSVFVSVSQTTWLIPTFGGIGPSSQAWSSCEHTSLRRSTVSLVTDCTSICPLNGMESRGWTLSHPAC